MVPPRVWGEMALTEFVEPTITVRVNGVTDDDALTLSCSPDGLEAKDRTTVFGSRRTLVVVLRPPASVAVSSSSTYDGYSWSGAENEPVATPGHL